MKDKKKKSKKQLYSRWGKKNTMLQNALFKNHALILTDWHSDRKQILKCWIKGKW